MANSVADDDTTRIANAYRVVNLKAPRKVPFSQHSVCRAVGHQIMRADEPDVNLSRYPGSVVKEIHAWRVLGLS